MKKFTPTLLGLMVGAAAFGQEQVNMLPAQLEVFNPETMVRGNVPANNSGSEAVLWSEDFANGIPSTWVNAGYDGSLNPLSSALWEYRGPSTTPSNAQGSIGAFSGVTTGNNAPIASSTTSNGFIIFDSDYLDNNGNPSNFGGGLAPAPHVGTLTTPSIDLSASPNVMLEMQSYARVFFANFQVAFSTDGGTTWGDTATIYTDASLGVNNASPNADLVQVNVSSYIGSQSNVKMRFIFDGRPGNSSGNGYYFWMLDDIALKDLPRHSLKFVDNADGAPAHDIIYGTNGGGKYGIMPLKQVRSIAFDSNVLNFGWDAQTNVALEVRILDGSNNVVQTLNSSSVSLASSAVADYTVMNTASWTPSSEDNYKVVYMASSDSVNAVSDTFDIYVTDSLMSLDFNNFTNRIGTGNIGDDGSALATRLDLEQDERLFAAEIYMSTATVAGGVIEVTVYDSTGFDYQNGFPTQPLAYFQHTITSGDVSAGYVRADLTGSDGYPVYLSTQNTGAYYIVVTFFSNNGANPIYLANDQTYPQPSTAAIMYNTTSTPRWYSGYINSLALNAPFIRAVTCPASAAATCMSIGIEEVSIESQVTVGPNPADDKVFVNFGDDFSGAFTYEVVDLQGRVIKGASETATAGSSLEVSLSELTPGVYMMNIAKGDAMSTFKLIVK